MPLVTAKHLVIVESPTKARKLKGYLSSDFAVEASVGHVRDLPKKDLGVDVEHNFEPVYEVSTDKKKVVATLRKLAKSADSIYLATDPDREGEAIAWHIQFLLQDAKSKTKFLRATFHEITKPAVLAAIQHPSVLNLALVDAQQARRVLDRLVGYKVSPVLWKKVRRGLSAGRVQSVALRLIVEREKEIQAFVPQEYWEIDVALAQAGALSSAKAFSEVGALLEQLDAQLFIARLEKKNDHKLEVADGKTATAIKQALLAAAYRVASVERVERKRQSLPPFTTSLLQQAAATHFGYSAKQTMSLAQRLYEEGLITYHRTDSFNLSVQAVEAARSYIATQFGQQYLPDQPRSFVSKAKNAQEAHEAIRVTEVAISSEELAGQIASLTPQHLKLYDLIRRRFLASQMTAAVYDQTTILTEAAHGSDKYQLRTSGSQLRFDGWRRLFNAGDDVILPSVTPDMALDQHDLACVQKFTQPPARYNDASLVKELEKRGIGRPSTYASIISVIVDRAYVERTQRKFFATAVGMTVCDFLLEHFPEMMDYDFTASMEADLDRIAAGEREWRAVIADFYQPLEKKIAAVVETAQRAQVPVEKTGESCPTCQEGEVVIRSGRFGKFKSCSRFPECKFTENIVEKLPDQFCPLCGKGEVVVKNTRWGKPFYGCALYPACDFASWRKPDKDYRLTKEEWALMQQKRAEWKAKRAATKKTTSKKTVAKKTTTQKTAAKKPKAAVKKKSPPKKTSTSS